MKESAAGFCRGRWFPSSRLRRKWKERGRALRSSAPHDRCKRGYLVPLVSPGASPNKQPPSQEGGRSVAVLCEAQRPTIVASAAASGSSGKRGHGHGWVLLTWSGSRVRPLPGIGGAMERKCGAARVCFPTPSRATVATWGRPGREGAGRCQVPSAHAFACAATLCFSFRPAHRLTSSRLRWKWKGASGCFAESSAPRFCKRGYLVRPASASAAAAARWPGGRRGGGGRGG